MSSRGSLSPISPSFPGVSNFNKRVPQQSSYTYPTAHYASAPAPASYVPWPSHPSYPAPPTHNSLAPPPPPAMHRRTPSLTSSISSGYSTDSRPITPPTMAPCPYPVKAHRGEYFSPAEEQALLRAPLMKTVPLPSIYEGRATTAAETGEDARTRAWIQAHASPATVPIQVVPPSPTPSQYPYGASAPVYPHRQRPAPSSPYRSH